MAIITRERSFYKDFFSIYWFLLLQNVIVLSVNLADNIMVGGYSEVALSGVAAVNQIQFVLQQVIMGAGDAMVVIATQYWGQKRLGPIRDLSSIAMLLGVGIAVLFFAGVSISPEGTLSLFTSDPAVIEQGAAYLKIVRFSYFSFAMVNILLATLRSVETIRIAFLTSLISLAVNCCINYVLIYGKLGAPEMGVEGAAVGTLVARILEMFIVVFYLAKKEKRLKLRLRGYFHFDRALARDYLRSGLPVIAVSAMWGVSTALQTVILGHMQAGAIAANSIASTLYLVLKVASMGASATAAILIGRTIGQGDIGKVKQYAKTLQVMFLAIGIVTSAALFVLRTPILSLYSLSEETLRLANAFILILCVTCIGTAYQMPVLAGIVRGGGDTRFVLINDLVSIWGIVLPLSFLGAFVWNWSPIYVVMCLNSDQIFKCAAACIKVNRFRWIKKLTQAEEQATQEGAV